MVSTGSRGWTDLAHLMTSGISSPGPIVHRQAEKWRDSKRTLLEKTYVGPCDSERIELQYLQKVSTSTTIITVTVS